MVEIVGQLFILTIGYVIGAAGVIFPLKLIGVSAYTTSHATFLVLALPLISVNVVEGFTRLWNHTPGTMGLGGLTAIIPMLIAGALIGLFLTVAPKMISPFDYTLPRSSESLTAWVAFAVISTVITIALWRFWPEPRARLF